MIDERLYRVAERMPEKRGRHVPAVYGVVAHPVAPLAAPPLAVESDRPERLYAPAMELEFRSG